MNPIPCSVGILTRNSGETIERALASVVGLDDVIVCDGGSTDGTLERAQKYGARVIPQDTAFLNHEGRIQDYSGVRNQMLALAKYDWFFFLDADEYATPELVAEIARVIVGEPKAYWVPRRYLWSGKVVDCATTYPNKQMRLFSKSVSKGFVKTVHERIDLEPGTFVETLKNPMIVPMDTTREALWRKWDRYVALEVERHTNLSVGALIRISIRHLRASTLYLVRLIVLLVTCRGSRLPLWREFAEHGYNAKVVFGLWHKLLFGGGMRKKF